MPTRAPSAGSATLTGYAPSWVATGLTREANSSVRNNGFKVATKCLVAWPITHSMTVQQLALNCLTGIGFVPANVVVVGFAVKSADLDSGGSALRQSIYLGASELCTAVAAASTGTNGVYVCTPTTTTAPTTVYLKTTTAATTAAAGSITVTPLYYSS